MNVFKMKLHDIEQKAKDFIRKVKKNWMKFKAVAKGKAIMTIIMVERKLGLKPRCAFCKERIFCEQYAVCKKSGTFHNVARCVSQVSSR